MSAARWYIAGPMTGHPDLNFPAFNARAAELRAAGFEVDNPAEINADPMAGWQACMRQDIARLVLCDVILLLPGWRESRGARLEYTIAAELGLMVVEHNPDGVGLPAQGVPA